MSTVYHTQSGSLILIPLAGIAEGDISITVEESTLRIVANTQQQARQYLLNERQQAYNHTFKLKANSDLDRIDAKLKHGLLSIHIPNIQKHKVIKVLAA